MKTKKRERKEVKSFLIIGVIFVVLISMIILVTAFSDNVGKINSREIK